MSRDRQWPWFVLFIAAAGAIGVGMGAMEAAYDPAWPAMWESMLLGAATFMFLGAVALAAGWVMGR